MNLIFKSKTIFTIVSIFAIFLTNAQLTPSGAYLMGNHSEIGIHNGGHEGTNTPLFPNHARSNQIQPSVFYGFVSNPQLDGWASYDGDFFTPGSPENGFGIQVGTTNYSNNASNLGPIWSAITQLEIPGTLSNYQVIGDCISVEWNGSIANIGVKIVYHLIVTELFYTTEVTLTNNTGATVNNLYYYRNLDPDNNVFLNGNYNTQNTVVHQGSGSCPKAMVSASQPTLSGVPPSYMALAAIGDNFRVSYGGFGNRNAANIWNGTGVHVGVEGSTNWGDQAISLAYRVNTLAPGASETFKFAIILDASQIDAAFADLYSFSYVGSATGTGSVCDPASAEATLCPGVPLVIDLVGPSLDQYTWTWSPAAGLSSPTGTSVEVTADVPTTYTLTGTPLNPCLNDVTELINIIISDGPELQILGPTAHCGEFDLADLVFTDINSIPGTIVTFHSEIPNSSTDMTNEWPSFNMNEGDVVYIMIADPIGGCYDYEQILISFGGEGAAGDDYTGNHCNTEGVLDLTTFLSPGVSNSGLWTDISAVPSGQFDETTGGFDVTGLADGPFSYMYIIEGIAPCENDTAYINVNIVSLVNAGDDINSNLCITSGTLVDLNTLLTTSDASGTWTETTGTPSGQFNASTGELDPTSLPLGTYTFEYFIVGCPSDFSNVSLTIFDQFSAGDDNFASVCNAVGSNINLNTLLENEDPGGVWAAVSAVPFGTFSTTTGVFNVSGLANGLYTFTYTQVATSPCLDDVATFTINVVTNPNAGSDNSLALCNVAGSSVNLNTLLSGDAVPGGVWTVTSGTPGGAFNAASGGLNTAGLTAGVYVFQYESVGSAVCPSDFAEFTITVHSQPTISFIPEQNHCDDYALQIINGTNLTGGQAYYTGPNGTGTQFNAGDIISSTTTLYAFDQSGTTPNCIAQQSFNVNINTFAPDVQFVSTIEPSCNGLSDGEVEIIVEAYDFSGNVIPNGVILTIWTSPSGATFSGGGTNTYLTGMQAGTWTIFVQDLNGCTSTITFDLSQPVPIDLVLNISNPPTCFEGNDGSATVAGVGGVGGYTYSWTPANPSSGNATYNNMTAGNYMSYVTDANGCIDSLLVIINQPAQIEAFFSVNHVLCYGDASGVITVDSVHNATNPVLYVWNLITVPNPPVTSNTATGLPAGSYQIKIQDDNNCERFYTITVSQNDSLYWLELDVLKPAVCRNQIPFDNGHGQIFAAAGRGGTGVGGTNFTYLWTENSTGATTTNSTWGNKNPGFYTIIATDEWGCTLTETIYLDSLSPIADFEITSADFTAPFTGTAVVNIELTNLSLNYAFSDDPNADTTFIWTFGIQGEAPYITGDINEIIQKAYLTEGIYEICLVVIENLNGCVDTACQTIQIFDVPALVIPNIFSPDGDGVNDFFFFPNQAIEEFTATVYDRWGKEIFVFTSIDDQWDGTNNSNGKECSDGVYFFIYEGRSTNNTVYKGQGNIHLVRTK